MIANRKVLTDDMLARIESFGFSLPNENKH